MTEKGLSTEGTCERFMWMKKNVCLNQSVKVEIYNLQLLQPKIHTIMEISTGMNSRKGEHQLPLLLCHHQVTQNKYLHIVGSVVQEVSYCKAQAEFLLDSAK